MGLFASFVVVPSRCAALAEGGLVTHEVDGWLYVKLQHDGIVEGAVEAAAVSGFPAVGADVLHNDEAVMFFADPGEAVVWFAVTPPEEKEAVTVELPPELAAYLDDGAAEVERYERLQRQWGDPGAHRAVAERLAEWSRRHAPRPTTTDAIVGELASLAEDRLLMAEDAPLGLLANLMGFSLEALQENIQPAWD